MRRSEDNRWKSPQGKQTHVVRLGGKGLNPLNHLASQDHMTLNEVCFFLPCFSLPSCSWVDPGLQED